MSTTTDEWFVSRGGQRFGPVTFAQVIEAAKGGRLEPRTDLLFGGGLGQWTPAGEVDGVFERSRAEEPTKDAAGHKLPDKSMADSGSYRSGEKPTKLDLPGAPRLGYILGVTVLPTILAIGLAKLMPQIQGLIGAEYGQYVPFILLLVPLFAVVITVKRFQNLAMSGWWTLALMVPLLNLWLNYRLIACPPGYAYTKKLDVWGWILAVLYWLSAIGSVVAFFLVGMAALKEFVDSGQWQQLQNDFEEMKTMPAE